MKFQIRGAEGFNRVYVPFITPWVVDIETNASAFPCELLCSIQAVHGEACELDGWVWNHCRHPGFCEANNTAVPCFSLVWDARPQFTEFVIQWLASKIVGRGGRKARRLSLMRTPALFPLLQLPYVSIRGGGGGDERPEHSSALPWRRTRITCISSSRRDRPHLRLVRPRPDKPCEARKRGETDLL